MKETAPVEPVRLDLVSRFSLLISYITMAFVPVIVVAIGYEVLMRYGFSRSSTWVHDLSIWLGAAIYLVSGIYAMQQRQHIAITIVYDSVPEHVRRIFKLICLATILVFSVAFIWGAGPDAWRSLNAWERAGTSWNPPIPGTIKPLIVVVVFLIAVQAVANFVVDRRGRAAGTTPVEAS